MFTSNVIIHRSESFTVTSYGNGASYAIDDHVREASFFIQDEEGAQDVERILDNAASIDNALADFVGYFDPTDDEQMEYFSTYGEVRYG